MTSTFNRTLAIALAAGVSISGMQAVAPVEGAAGTFAPAAAQAQDQAQTSNPEPAMLPNTSGGNTPSYVYYEATIDGQYQYGDVNNPRFYTLQQARVIANTEKSLRGYLRNNLSLIHISEPTRRS